MARPYWSGQIQISSSLSASNSFPPPKQKVKSASISESCKPANASITRKFADEGPVEKDEIVKGYEYRKGDVTIEPEEIAHLRILAPHPRRRAAFVG